jgi:PAS domain S-box-containing protein
MIAEKFFHSLLASENTDVFQIDRDGIFTSYHGNTLLHFLNRTNSFAGSSFYESFQQVVPLLEAAKETLCGKTTSAQEWKCDQMIDLRMFPERTNNGEINGAIGMVFDKTLASQTLGTKENRWLLETALESIQDGIMIVDEHLMVHRVNHLIRNKLPENTPEKFICYEAIADLSEPCSFCPCRKTFQTGERYKHLYYDSRHDIWSELTSIPIFHPVTGKIPFVIEYVRDVTDQHHREERLKHQKVFLSAVIDASSDGIIALADGLEEPFANTQYDQLFEGWQQLRFNEPLEVVKKFYDEKLWDADVLMKLIAEVRETHQLREGIVHSKAGQTIIVRGRVAHTGLGKTGITEIWTHQDITAQLQFDQKRRIMQNAIDNISVPLCHVSDSGHLVYVNHAMVQSLGYETSDQLIGRSINELCFSSAHQEWSRFWEKLLDEKVVIAGSRVYRRNQPDFPAELSCDLIEQDEKKYAVICIHDLTDQMLRQEAEKISVEKSKFLAHMSHEIRTPLNGVIGMCDLLLGTTLNPKQQEYAALAQSSGKHLLSLISDILDFSKIESGKLEIEYAQFNLPELIDSVFGILAPTALNKQLELCEVFRNKIPTRVMGDSSRIRQILVNFIGNAIKFTSKGGIQLVIEVLDVDCSQTVPRYRTRFHVIDSGIGIPTSQLNRLFNSFSQADSSTTRQFGGTGLGLAISKELVHLMEGTVGVESVENKGSDFWFEIPFPVFDSLDPIPDSPTPESATPTPESATPFSKSSKKEPTTVLLFNNPLLIGVPVFVVANNPVLRHAITSQLNAWAMNVSSFSDLHEAKEHYNSQSPPRFILTDQTVFELPESVEAGKWLRNNVKTLPPPNQTTIILLVPIGESTETSESLQSFADLSLTKPVLAIVLARTLTAVLDGTGLEEQRQRFQLSLQEESEQHESSTGLPDKIPMILVAEDNRINQMVIAEMLNRANYQYEVTQNGIEACKAITQTTFDVILMDCQMPEMDGLEATRMIREMEQGKNDQKPVHHGRIPIIALTANATKSDEEQCHKAGMDAFCSKPIESEKLFALIRHWLAVNAEGKE